MRCLGINEVSQSGLPRDHGVISIIRAPVLGALPEVLEHGGDVEAVLELVVVARVLNVAIQEQQRGGQRLLSIVIFLGGA